MINSAAPLFGLGAGALVSSLMAAYAPAPTHLVYALVLGVFIVQGCLAWRLPETVTPRPGVWRSMLPKLAVPQSARRSFIRVMPIDIACWAFGGFVLSLGPTLARQITGWQGPVVGGLMILALTGTGAVSSLWLRERAERPLMRMGSATLALGVGAVLLSTVVASTSLFFAGMVVAGFGFGVSFLAAVRGIMSKARPEERASLMAAFLVLSYCAFSLPALAAGVAVNHFGMTAASQTYGAVVIVLAVMALAATRERSEAGDGSPAVAAID